MPRSTDGTDHGATGGLVRALESSDRFRRDGPLGRIFHPGRISFREVKPRDSLHIVIDGERVSVHVDEVCPLRCRPGQAPTYAWTRVLAHNLSVLAADVNRRLRGQHGLQRCNLGCEVVWEDDDQIAELTADVQKDESSDPPHGTGCGE